MRIVLLLGFLLGAPPVLGGSLYADDPWVDRSVEGALRCRAEFSLAGHQRLFRDLAQLRTDLQAILDLDVGAKPIQLNLFRSRDSYQAYLRRRVPAGAAKQALYVQGPKMSRVYAYRHEDFMTDVRHEYTHALLHNTLPYLPLWLDEGLAEYFELRRSRRASGHEHLNWVRFAAHFWWTPELEELEQKKSLSEMTAKSYRDAWAWVHFLMHDSPRSRRALLNYLKAIDGGDPPGAFSNWIRTRIPGAQRRLKAHFKTWKE